MGNDSRATRAILVLGLALLTAQGCAFGRGTRTIDRTPAVDRGVGATIIMPGQTVPQLRTGTSPTGGSAATGSPEGGSGSASPGRAPVTFIGGSEIDEESHVEYKEEPIWAKYVLWPFALVAAPFKAAANAMAGDEEPGPELPQPQASQPPPVAPPPVEDYETQQLRKIQQELAQRRSHEGEPQTAPAATHRAAPARAPSIADELAALQRAPVTPDTRTAPVHEAAERSESAPSGSDPGEAASQPHAAGAPVAHGIVDRNGDGRIDHWIYRDAGEIVREAFDEDFDGRVDRTLIYDPSEHRVSRIEEDSNADGSVDVWTDYRKGELVRRRADGNHDGIVDSWSFYRDGQVARLEQDSNGDGYRNRVSFFVAGRLDREERDRDGDGRSDVVIHYDAAERVKRREEDRDGDGRADVISHYEEGRLKRRELLDASAAPELANSLGPREP